MMQKYGYPVAGLIIALFVVLFVIGLVRNPVTAQRQQFERQLAEFTPPEWTFDAGSDREFAAWQNSVAARPALWGPLMPPPKISAPPPALQQMLAGVEPTRNTMGFGQALKIQIKVDGKKEWFAKGQQVKGCTLEEIQDGDVMFTIVQDGQKHGIRIPRK